MIRDEGEGEGEHVARRTSARGKEVKKGARAKSESREGEDEGWTEGDSGQCRFTSLMAFQKHYCGAMQKEFLQPASSVPEASAGASHALISSPLPSLPSSIPPSLLHKVTRNKNHGGVKKKKAEEEEDGDDDDENEDENGGAGGKDGDDNKMEREEGDESSTSRSNSASSSYATYWCALYHTHFLLGTFILVCVRACVHMHMCVFMCVYF